MTFEAARMSIGRHVVNTMGIEQPNGPYLPSGSTFLLESVGAGMFEISWPSPRGKLNMRLPTSSLDQFARKADFR
jgi:hypothetical protein